MTRNKAGIIGLGLLALAGAYGLQRTAYNARYEAGRDLCVASAGMNAAQVDRINIADGLKAGVPFSVDDYCGAQCRPGSMGWDACLDGCRDYCE